ncbi:Hypothetical predicted protein [Pelobates cultripes]|uniref:Smr domain-containing protein n=1 Tax=Pelobates cultripes TaxID=61616 RepID=A0AAD1SIQ3_PELCU|nr:Hypothetical predicted protein [Pelobates cultripes]
MPRKRKSLVLSPLRKASASTSASWPPLPSSSSSAVPPLPQAMSNKCNERLLSRMCEMFSNLDPTLVEMVLSEYKEVEVVDHLLELSNAAKMESQSESADKYGFDMIASYLDGDQVNLSPGILGDVANEPTSTEESQAEFCMDMALSNDLDSLLDEALIRFSNSEHAPDTAECNMFDNVDFQDLLQTASAEDVSFPLQHSETDGHTSGDIDIAYHMYLGIPENKVNDAITDCSTETEFTKTSEMNDLEREFSVKLDMFSEPAKQSSQASACVPESIEKIETGDQKVNPFDVKPVSIPSRSSLSHESCKYQQVWNPLAPTFYPVSVPTQRFVTPVSTAPATWTFVTDPTIVAPGTYFTPPVAPYTWNIGQFSPNNWYGNHVTSTSQHEAEPQTVLQSPKKMTHFAGKVLILLRGAPGSGKSTLARMLLQKNPFGIILSTDDYFAREGLYRYDPSCLGEAHEWNYKRAKEAFEKNVSPILIDNTNMQGWEMKPYVSLAVKHKYKVMFREPDTWWKYKPKELERRNKHGVKRDKIARMLDSFERVTVNSILNLSHPKISEKANVGQTTLANKEGQNNILSTMLIKEDDVTSSQKTHEIIIDTSVSGTSAICSEITSDANTSKKEDNTDFEAETSNDLMPSGDKMCSRHIVNKCDEISQVPLNTQYSDESSLLLSEKPELLNFVGDWPVEQQTMCQRAPRIRKKVRPNKTHKLPSHQICEDDKNTSSQSKQTDSDPVKPAGLSLTEDVSVYCSSELSGDVPRQCKEVDALSAENEDCIISERMSDDASDSEGEQNPNPEVVDLISNLLQNVSEAVEDKQNIDLLTSINEDENIISFGKPGVLPKQLKRNCHQYKLTSPVSNCTDSSNMDENQSKSQCQETDEDISVGPNKSSQTEPHEFALLWRIERKNLNALEPTKVLTGKSDRFKSKLVDESSDCLEIIPYRVMHHKSTFVEEDEITSLGDEDNLNILCKLFRSLSFDVLNDLYERCNKDILWATNLLLDSGEKLHIDEDCSPAGSDRSEGEEQTDSDSFCQSNLSLKENYDNFASLDRSSDISVVGNNRFVGTEILMECSDVMSTVLQIVSEESSNFNASSVSDLSNTANKSPDIIYKSSLDKNCEVLPVSLSEESDLETENLHGSTYAKERINSCLELNDTLPDSSQKPSLSDSDESQEELDIKNKISLVENCEVTGDPPRVSTDPREEDKTKKSDGESVSKKSLQFDHLELSLPPELAHQLSELFGPVGIDPGSLTIEDCVVRIDLNLAQAIHKRWKDSITERQEALSYQLIFEDSEHLDVDNMIIKDEFPGDTYTQETSGVFPFMDQWNARTKKVSLRQIMSEEIALQAQEDLKRSSPIKNCASKLKEKQLFEMFPFVEQKLLMDIFKENNYSLAKTVQFMSSVLEAGPVHTVMAPDIKPTASGTTEKSREKKSVLEKEILSGKYFQDFDAPDYDDFRAEAFLYRKKQQENYKKAAEAHSRGMKHVASFYAQQGHLYGEKVKEENRRAAVQIFQRANEFLLPENILDLHGLHVDEAMKHFRQVLKDKMEEYKQNGGKAHLSVITGRGNHSQGGVPRIKLAVTDYLTNHKFRFTEARPGVLCVSLK